MQGRTPPLDPPADGAAPPLHSPMLGAHTWVGKVGDTPTTPAGAVAPCTRNSIAGRGRFLSHPPTLERFEGSKGEHPPLTPWQWVRPPLHAPDAGRTHVGCRCGGHPYYPGRGVAPCTPRGGVNGRLPAMPGCRRTGYVVSCTERDKANRSGRGNRSMAFVTLREGESPEGLLSRFRSAVTRTGILKEHKDRRFFRSKGEKARLAARRSARRRRRSFG